MQTGESVSSLSLPEDGLKWRRFRKRSMFLKPEVHMGKWKWVRRKVHWNEFVKKLAIYCLKIVILTRVKVTAEIITFEISALLVISVLVSALTVGHWKNGRRGRGLPPPSYMSLPISLSLPLFLSLSAFVCPTMALHASCQCLSVCWPSSWNPFRRPP